MHHDRRLLALAVLGLGLLAAAPVAQAQQSAGRYRIELMSGKFVEGDLKELPDGSYEVKTRHGVTVKLKKSEVRGMRPLDEAAGPTAGGPQPTELEARPAATAVVRREISDQEIEEVLSGITASPDEELTGADSNDMMSELPLNEESLADMLREAGIARDTSVPIAEQDNVLIKPHFAMVYTSSEQSARELGARLEAVYRWNVKFMDILKLPARRPEYKLELYYFGDFEEYEKYSLNHGHQVRLPGVGLALGYYDPEMNRSHFFDMNTSPDIKEFRDMLADSSLPWERRQFATNRIKQYVEFKNMEVIQHETGHHIHFNIGLFPRDAFGGGGVPIWLVEGTTMMFEVPPSAAGASLGVLNHYRLNSLRNKFGQRPLSPSDWKLFLIDNARWSNAAGRGTVVDSYQLGWSMVYYLWKERREGYARYLQRVFGREEGETLTTTEREQELEECLGRIDDKWIEDYYKFLSTLQVRPSLLPPGEQVAASPDQGKRSGDSSRKSQPGPPRGGPGGRGRG